MTLLVEDQRHEVFVRRVLLALGCRDDQIRIEKPGPGVGSGEAFVRDKYPTLHRVHRRRSAYRKLLLIVVTDADLGSVDDRRRYLSEAIAKDGSAEPEREDTVAFLIPKQNIETWLFYLMGEKVDEATDYKDGYARRYGRANKCQPAIDRFVSLYSPTTPLPDDCPDSLRRGIDELRRVL